MADFDVAIIGGGVTGAATLYMLARYTNVRKIVLIEKYESPGQVNSSRTMNSQTLHFGDIETNYAYGKAKKVKEAAELTRRYLESHEEEGLFLKSHKMVLATGKKEAKELEKRYKEFKKLYPSLRKAGRKEIERLEPAVVAGRPEEEELLALVSEDGYVVDYGKLASSLIHNAQKEKGKHIEIVYGEKIRELVREEECYLLKGSQEISASAVLVATGPDSLLFAHRLGYAQDCILLPVAGSFYRARNLLNGKVYTMQLKKLPFAAVHGDPSVDDPGETRFGPTAKVLPMMERYRYRSILDFLRLFKFRIDAIGALFAVLSDPVYLRYVAQQVLYDVPAIGTWFFMKQNVKKIVPGIKYKDISYGRGLGGIRPQILNVKTRKMEMGEAKFTGDNIVFDVTPSPGASVCISNGKQNAEIALKFLGKKYRFSEKKFEKELK